MDPIEQNILGVQQLVSSKVNKTSQGVLVNSEGVEGELKDELELDLTDQELLNLKNKIEKEYAPYEDQIRTRQQANLTYYLGKQKTGSPEAVDGMVVSDNLLFEATETLVPASLSKNPEPVVFSDDTKEGDELSTDVKIMLQYHADTLSLRSQLNLMVRKWMMDLLSVMKHGWDKELMDIVDDVRDVKNFIFDINGYIDVYGSFVGLLGERIKSTAQELVDEFPKHEAYITVMVNGKMGTEVVRTEWWNDKYTFTTFKDKVLDKSKNPHYNYTKKVTTTDEFGNEIQEEEKGNNHFGRSKKPYTFLSVYSFGDKPHDVTSPIEQNIPNQRRITRRTDQIDFNLSKGNNSDVFSENNFNQETATQAKNALAKGNPILVPSGGPINEAIVRLQGQGIESSFFDDLENQKTALRMSFGTEGLTASPPDKNELATGIVANEQHDTSRISGGIGDALERVAKGIFNQHVQFYYVYYDVPHTASIMGQMRAVEYSILSSDKLNKKLVVSVSPDSMKPHDEITEMNQAITLYQEKALDPKTLLTRINFPDPQNTAEQTVLWLIDPQAYMQINFPEIAQKQQMIQQQMMAQQQAQQQQQMQMEQQQGQMQMEQQGQQAQQGMAIKEATTEQALQQKQQAHEQKLRQQEETHKQKIELANKNVKSNEKNR